MNGKKTSKANSATVPIADMERAATKTQDAEREDCKSDTRISINVHSVRKRPVDPDGISAKAAIDGLVLAGLLEDDNLKHVKEVTYSQQACDRQNGEEVTIISLYEG